MDKSGEGSVRENICRNINILADSESKKKDFAEKIGAGKQSVSNWVKGRNTPDIEMLADIANAYGVSLNDMCFGTVSDNERETSKDIGSGFIDIPVYGHIAAGTPIDMIGADFTQPVPLNVILSHKHGFLLKVEGESMNRRIPDGSLVLIDPDEKDIIDGKPYAVCINGYSATVKKIRRLENGLELVPDSWDKTYRPIQYDFGNASDETLTVIGRAVWMTAPFDYEI